MTDKFYSSPIKIAWDGEDIHDLSTCSPNKCEHNSPTTVRSHCSVEGCPNSTFACPKNQAKKPIDPNSAYFAQGY